MTAGFGSITSAYSTSSDNAPHTAVPLGASAGDVFTWVVMKANGDTITPPTGFTALDSAGEASIGSGFFTFSKVSDGTESGTFTGSASTYSKWLCLCFINNGVSSTLVSHNATDVYANYTSTIPCGTGSVASSSGDYIVGIFAVTDVGSAVTLSFTQPTGFTIENIGGNPILDVGGARGIALAYKTSPGETTAYSGTIDSSAATTFSGMGAAIVFTPSGGGGTTLGGSAESSSSGSLTTQYSSAIGSSSEAEFSSSLGSQYSATLGAGYEAGVGGTLTAQIAVQLSGAAETDSSYSVSTQYSSALVGAPESSAANALLAQYSFQISSSLESEVSGALSSNGQTTLVTASESGSSAPLSFALSSTLSTTYEAQSAYPIAAAIQLQTAQESEAAGALSSIYQSSILGANEYSAAGFLGESVTLLTAVEVAVPGSIGTAYSKLIGSAAETDAAFSLDSQYQFSVGAPHETAVAGALYQITANYLTGKVTLTPSLSAGISLKASLDGVISLNPS
jgi:hypothetical protein